MIAQEVNFNAKIVKQEKAWFELQTSVAGKGSLWVWDGKADGKQGGFGGAIMFELGSFISLHCLSVYPSVKRPQHPGRHPPPYRNGC